jgi:Protein of unknown function (DUF2488)
MTTYYFMAASDRFLFTEEPTDEVITERIRNYQENEKEIDFWVVKDPAFLNLSGLESVKAQVPTPAAAIVSTNKSFIVWLKLRLEFVVTGEFESNDQASAIASLVSV